MRVSVETMSGLERRVTVGVPADRVDSAVQKRLARSGEQRPTPGFPSWQGAYARDAAALWRGRSPRSVGRGNQSVVSRSGHVRKSSSRWPAEY